VTSGEQSVYRSEGRARSYDPIFTRANAAILAWFQEAIEHWRGLALSPRADSETANLGGRAQKG